MLTLDSVVLRFLKFGHSRRRLVQPIVLLLFLVFFALAALAEPMLDWDMLAYVANAYQYLGLVPSEELHRTVYTDLQSSVPAADFERLISSPSRQVLYQDPEAFRQTIAFFYDTRVIYTGMVAGLIKLGLNPFFATYFISTLCAVGSVLLLARLVPTKLPLAMSLALPFIALSCGLLDVARDSSPDSLATLVTIALYWILLRDKIPLLLVLLPLVVFVRKGF